jgi:hypothetical protein
MKWSVFAGCMWLLGTAAVEVRADDAADVANKTCAGVLDRTAECAAPDRGALAQTADAVPEVVAEGWQPSGLAVTLAILGVGVAGAGGGLLAAGLLTPAATVKDYTPLILAGAGVGALGTGAGLLFSSLALVIFDPRNGTLSLNLFKAEES